MTCPRCGSIEVDSTTMGGIIFPGAEAFDDANRSTCQKCHHKGSTGDWERLDKLRAALAAAEANLAALRDHPDALALIRQSLVIQESETIGGDWRYAHAIELVDSLLSHSAGT